MPLAILTTLSLESQIIMRHLLGEQKSRLIYSGENKLELHVWIWINMKSIKLSF